MIIQELRCFGVRPGEGNAALVIRQDDADAATRQRHARAQNRSACVFIDPPPAGDEAAFVLDYFYPHARSPLCLHATLAAAAVLLAEREGPLRVRTAMRGQLLTLSRNASGVFVSLAPQAAPTFALPAGLPAALLGRPGLVLASAPAVASVGSPKLLLEMTDCAALQALRPDLALIAEWSREHGVSGCYAYARRGDGSFEGRNFNHLDPALEDSATGVAAGALSAHLGRGLTLYQGANMGQPCMLRTELLHEQILIGGATEFV